MPGEFYVYLLYRPDGRPCYVGKGKGDRWFHHGKRGHRSKNLHLLRIIKLAGGSLRKEKIADGLSEADAFALEIATISNIGRRVNGGPLVNMTDGGEGVSGHRHSAETRAKLGIAATGKKYRLGMKASDETRAKQSLKKIGSKQSPDHVESRISKIRGRKRPPDVCAKISAGKIGKHPRKYTWSPEARERQAERFRDPELRAKIGAGTRAGIAAARKERATP